MKTTLDCYSCFLKSALRGIRLAGVPEVEQQSLFGEVLLCLHENLNNESPLAVTHRVQRLIAQRSGCIDPYLHIKRRCSREASEWLPFLRKKMTDSSDPLLFALKSAVIGNMMDFGVFADYNLDALVAQLDQQEFEINSRSSFEKSLQTSKTLTFFADNTGEIYFDALLIEYLCREYCLERVKLVIRKHPFLNDVSCWEDVPTCLLEMPQVELIQLPIMIDECESSQWNYVVDSDIVLCKGMANFENYSEQSGFHFLLVCKCDVTAREVGSLSNTAVKSGDWVFFKKD